MDAFDHSRILMNDLPFKFLLEVVLRTVIMFLVILITLRVSGKRGIKQLSVFELVLIIGLGSAAGDPMFYEDVGLLPAFVVFTVIIVMYTLVTRLADRVRWVEKLLEGEPSYVVLEGRILLEELERSSISREELFGELRLQHVEHLGQVRVVLLETSGELSVLFYPEESVLPGLPIFPDMAEEATEGCDSVCYHCGHLAGSVVPAKCPDCGGDRWCKPLSLKKYS